MLAPRRSRSPAAARRSVTHRAPLRCDISCCGAPIWGPRPMAQAQECACNDVVLSHASMTVWPSGLRRWLKAPFRKGVGSNPTAVNADQLEPPPAPWYSSWSPHPTPKSRSRDSGHGSCFGGRHRIGGACGSYIECAAIACLHDNLAEQSKAVAQGAIPQGCGLEPHRRQHSACKTHVPPLDQFVQNITNRSKHGCDTLLR